jgi:hypothetical protein
MGSDRHYPEVILGGVALLAMGLHASPYRTVSDTILAPDKSFGSAHHCAFGLPAWRRSSSTSAAKSAILRCDFAQLLSIFKRLGRVTAIAAK